MRWLSRGQVGLEFVLICAALWHCTTFALALSWRCVDHMLSLHLCFGALALALLWWWCIDHALILWQRLDVGFASCLRLGTLAFALSWKRLSFALALLQRWLVHDLVGKLSTSRLGSPCAQGTSASNLAVVAISALPAGLTPAVPLARADAAPTTGNASPRSCVSTHGCLTSLATTFSGTAASLKGSTFLGKEGESPGNDGTPPDSCRTSACGPGG